ncbi:Hypothetical protein AA314_04132 [Archangium gephyra]|uniref:GlsB/YeaQ/YmgE family stress response membrane protein n=1 Tax=Archangium gephyra TaxID=48 RepID=A0AAC8TFF6_9BACT|nr:Hypothetical protein AA314_04132 [Archangium gephyra]
MVLLFLLLLLMPRAGLAAEDAPLVSLDAAPTTLAPTSNTEEHGPSLLEEPAFGDDQRNRAPLALRLLAEVGGGVATTLAGGLAGLVLCQVANLSQGEWGCIAPVFVGLAVGTAVSPLGVWWGGEAVGGDGRLSAAFWGGIVGGLVGGLLVGSLMGGGLVSVLPVFGMITIGASLGYELSQRPESPEPSAAHPRIQPMLAFDGRGGMLGLSGRF